MEIFTSTETIFFNEENIFGQDVCSENWNPGGSADDSTKELLSGDQSNYISWC